MRTTPAAYHVAEVGYTGSVSDRMRGDKAVLWLIRNGGSALGRPWLRDKLNLETGRDFLAEQQTYHVVILHFLYRGGMGWTPQDFGQFPGIRTSPLTSWSRWRTRLAATQADYIFPYGEYGEVSGSFLCTLDGYNIYRDPEDHQFWVCVRNELPQPRGMQEPKDILAYDK